jgi:beta-xylosidase
MLAYGMVHFRTTAIWKDGWPTFNDGKPILLSEEVGPKTGPKKTPPTWIDKFCHPDLDLGWSQIRTPYTRNYQISNGKLSLKPNVFGLSDRDTSAALFRKQKSLNMTFSAELLQFKGTLGPRMRVGVSAYLSEFQHQDIGIRGCLNQTGMCLYTDIWQNQTLNV